MSIEDVLLAASEQGVYFYVKDDKLAYKAKKDSLSSEFRTLITERHQEIKRYLEHAERKAIFTLPQIDVADRSEALPLSFAQQRLWFIDQLEGSLQYINQGQLLLEGNFNNVAFEMALQTLLERHEVLRTNIVLHDGQARQIVRSEFNSSFRSRDLSRLGGDELAAAVLCLKQQEQTKPFDLSQDLMLRVWLITLSAQHHLVVYTSHHIASDGWSSGILRRELLALYAAFSERGDNPLPELPLQYADYAVWQRHWLQGEVLEQQLAYWKKQLADLPSVHQLPLDKPRPPEQGYAGRGSYSVVDKDTTRQIASLCEQFGVTRFMFLQTAFTVLLGRYSNETDIVVGTPIAGRTHRDLEKLIGFFINSLVLRTDLSGNPRFSSLLSANKQVILDGFTHQHIPFEMLVEAIRPERDMSHNALFQILFVLQNNERGLVELPAKRGDDHVQDGLNIRFDLALHLVELSDELLVHWSWREDLFADGTIARMARNYRVLLRSIVAALAAAEEPRIGELALIDDAERHLLLEGWNTTAVDYPRDQCLHELFETQVALKPNATAVICENHELSYRALNAEANRLAHYLIELGVRPDSLVALSVERSFATMIGLFGILKAGAAYVPLDPSYPEARLAFMLEDCGARIIVSQRPLMTRLPITEQTVICLDDAEVRTLLDSAPDTNPATGVAPQNAAYVIYTSGSTGRPKGVVVNHDSVCNFVLCAVDLFLSEAIQGSVVSSPLAFDATVQSLYVALCAGRYVELLPEDERLLNHLADYLVDDEDALLFKITPTHLKALSSQQFVRPSPRARHVLVVAGEIFSQDTLRPWQALLPNARFINEYGPTEATVGSCSFEVDVDLNREAPSWQSSGTGIPIGRPFANAEFFILDSELRLQPIGVPGELYIGGAGLARKYLHQPALTSDKFVPHPFSHEPGARIYRTGDLVRYLAGGEVEFIGRIDDQVKVRGFRIELGEIESALLDHASVDNVVVIARAGNSGAQRLIAYVVLDKGCDRARDYQGELNVYLHQLLPDYMVPAAYVVLNALPMTPSGKVDRKALPDPEIGAFAQHDFVAPVTASERLLADLWAELLQLDHAAISSTANFFALGGHSLLVMELIARLQDRNLPIAVRTVFNSSTLAELAAQLDAAPAGVEAFRAAPNLITADCTAITPALLPLAELSQDEIDRIVAQVPGGVSNIQDIYPLVPLQAGILFHHLLDPLQDPYVIDKGFFVEHEVLVEHLLAALQIVVERHDILRTAIICEGLFEPMQVVLREADLKVTRIALADTFAERDIQSQGLLLALKEELPPIVLEQAPIVQVVVASTGQGGCYFVLRSHHLVADHVGNDTLWSEVEALLAGRNDGLPPPAPYREFVAHVLHQAAQMDAHAYFREQLADISEPTLPFGLVDVHGDGRQLNRAQAVMNAALSERVRRVARQLQMSPASLFHAAWALVVGACSGREAVIFGTVLSGRLQGTVGAERMLGLFINTLPLRIDLDRQPLRTFIERVDRSLKTLVDYEHSPLTVAQRCSSVANDVPLFSALLNYRHTPNANVETTAAPDAGPLRGVESGETRTNYPFTLAVSDWGEDFNLKCSSLEPVCAERVIDYTTTALAALVDGLEKQDHRSLRSLSILPAGERRQLLETWNTTHVDYPQGCCVHHLFEAQVTQSPEQIAVIGGGLHLTYRELNAAANCLAHDLIARGVGPESLVALSVTRSAEAMIGLLGIMKAGAAYVPLDPDFPSARLAYMLRDSGAEIIVSQSALLERLPISGQGVICLDRSAYFSTNGTGTHIADFACNPTTLVNAQNTAYVIYTSGSTGQPKGVVVEHASVCNFLYCAAGLFLNDDIKGSIVSSPLAFDATVQSLYVPLCAGRYVKLLPEDDELFTNLAAELMREDEGLLFKITPTHLKALSARSGVGERHNARHVIVVAGEPLTRHILDPWLARLPASTIINEYGPTEATVGSSTFRVREPKEHDPVNWRASSPSVPIGRPFANAQFYVLDCDLGPVPLGAPGELYIGGAGLAREYLHRPDLTGEKFIANPFSNEKGARLYKTGDLVRYLADGNVEFLGRIDSQVKIRGLRIELGEIESRLLKEAEVREAVVLAREDAAGDSRLVAYVVLDNSEPDENTEFSKTQIEDAQSRLSRALRNNLPDCMVPAAYVVLETLPLTPNGKVDRKALPAPGLESFVSTQWRAPATATEQLLAILWGELLELPGIEISANANFFALGGHSLMIMHLIAKLQAREKHTDVRSVFNSATLAELAERIDQSDERSAPFVAPANLIPADCTHITVELLPLVELNENELERIVKAIPGGAANIQDIYPLAPLQEGILFHHLLNPEQDPYVTGNLMLIERVEAVEGRVVALQQVIERHDTLRTAILNAGLSTAVQVVQRQVTLPVYRVTLDPQQDIETQLAAAIAELPRLQLDQAPLLRVLILSTPVSSAGEPGPSYFYQQSHHIVSDHVGSAILRSEIEAILSGQREHLPAAAPYRNFVAHALHQMQKTDAEAWFREQLRDVTEPTLPFGLGDVRGDGQGLERAQAVLDTDIARNLRLVARQLQVSPATLFHAAWALVVGACSGRDNVVFGTVMSGRLQGIPGAERMVGLIMNTLVLHVDLRGRDVQALVKETDSTLKDLVHYEQTPLALAQSCSGVSNEMPLFSALLNYRHSGSGQSAKQSRIAQNEDDASGDIRSLGADGRSNYPFELSVSDWGDDFSVHVNIARTVAAERIVDYTVTAITALVEALQKNTATPALDLSVLPTAEWDRQINDWNHGVAEYDREKTVHALFEERVKCDPDAIALVFSHQVARPIQLSYNELNCRANQLAHVLIELGATPETRVGICVERSVEMIIALLGVLKAGACYLPLHPEYPLARLSFLVDDGGIDLIVTKRSVSAIHGLGEMALTEESKGETEKNRSFRCVYLDRDSLVWTRPVANPEVSMSADNLAYVIHTSGSTGEPKGVAVSHRSLHNLALFQSRQYSLDRNSRILQFASFSFDAATWDWSMALVSGSVLHLISESTVNSAEEINNTAGKCAITYSFVPPALLGMLNQADFRTVRTLTVGGETPSLDTLKAWAVGRQTFNAYGPTENTVVATNSRVDAEDKELFIGKGIENVRCYVLNHSALPVPYGVPGELYLGGEGLARGYLDRASLTAQQFVPDPYSGSSGERLYRTGDLVRFAEQPHGSASLEFLGRADEQIKIRGFRIEPGEIEHVLRQQDSVHDVHVLARGLATVHSTLVAFFVQAGAEYDENQMTKTLRRALESSLPEYMVPTAFVRLDALPLTLNGKVDKEALAATAVGVPDQSAYLAPETGTEKLLAELWADLLQIEPAQVSTNANFFALGGHSLLVMNLVSRLQAHDLHTEVRNVFNTPTLAELARSLDEGSGRTEVFAAPANLIPENCEIVTPDLLPLVELSESEIGVISRQVPGGDTNIQDIYPLAPLQEGILFHHLLSPERDPYVIEKMFVVEQEGLVDEMISALQQVVARHDVLRTAVISEGLSTPVQVVHRTVELPVHRVSLLSHLMPGDAQTRSELSRLKSRLAPMPLASAPLVRVIVASSGPGYPEYFLLQFHHIILDHVGDALMRYEMSAILAGEGAHLPPSIPYRDFVAHVLYQARHKDAESWFREQLAEVDQATLPFGLVDVRGDGQALDRKHLDLDSGLAAAVRNVARSRQIGPAILFHAAWAVVVGACSDRDDVVFGTVLSGRLQGVEGTERMLGLFINTLPIRVRMRGRTIDSLVEELDQNLKRLLNYEQTSLVLALKCSSVANDMPLFSALLNYRHSYRGSASGHARQLEGKVSGLGGEERTNYPFSLSVSDWGDEFSIDVINVNEVSADRVAAYVMTVLKTIVEALAGNIELPLSVLTVVPESEQQALFAWNKSNHAYPEDKCIHELFEARVGLDGDALALVDGAGQTSYRDLNSRANQLAHYLIEQGYGPECRIGICMNRGSDMVIAILGILKAGAAYVPIDPLYPQERIAFLVEDSGVSVVLSENDLMSKVTLSGLRLLMLDDERNRETISQCSDRNIPEHRLSLSPDNLSYLIYTSGSTGRPKGVMGVHRSIVNRIHWLKNSIGVNKGEVLCQKTSIGFVDHVAEIFQALTAGVPLVILPTESVQTPAILNIALNRHEITQLTLVPSLLNALLDSGEMHVPGLKSLYCSGEALSIASVESFKASFPNARLWNIYGSTEVGADVTACELDAELVQERVSLIGKAIDNCEAYILDMAGKLVPLGVVGELCIGGAGLSRGYCHQPGLTAERFVPHPFSDQPGARLYRTGDLARYEIDEQGKPGNIGYVGRADQQVNIRGFRIELAEIEFHLQSHSQVKEAVVLARQDRAGDLQLVAYVVPADRGPDTDYQTDLRSYLQQHLPHYMVPTACVVLDALPLTPNGKMDRLALEKIDPALPDNRDYVAPVSPTEKQIAGIWAELLQHDPDRIGSTANFFALGGHSLIVMKLVSRLREQNLYADVRTVLNAHTLFDLAKVIDESQGQHDGFIAPANLIPSDCRAITPEMLPLVDLKESEISAIVEKIPGGAANIQDIYPLVPLQEGILFHNLLNPDQDPFVLDSLLPIEDAAQIDAITEALQQVIGRHDVLRTAIIVDGISAPVQVVLRQATLPVRRIELNSAEDRQVIAEQLRECNSSMNLAEAPLLRVVIGTTESHPAMPKSPSYLLLQFHHIISDNVAALILRRELSAILAGQGAQLPSPVPYREFVAHVLRRHKQVNAEAWFSEQLGDVSEPTLPFALVDLRERPALDQLYQDLTVEQSQKIRSIAREQRMSPASIFHAAWALVVGMCSGREDVVFGTVLLGRLQGTSNVEQMLGLFINTLPIRIRLEGRDAATLIQEVDQGLKALLDYEQCSLAQAQSCSAVDRHLPLFSALFNYRHAYRARNNEAIETQDRNINPGTPERTNYPFSMLVNDYGDAFSINAITVAGLKAERVARYYLNALDGLIAALERDDRRPLSHLDIVPQSEKQLLYDWNSTEATFPETECIHELFETQVESQADRTAVIYQDRQVTYRELNERANRLAHYLRSEGVVPDIPVGICVERSQEMMVALLAILKAGGCYVPLDPRFPHSRLAWLIEDSGIQRVITQSSIKDSEKLSALLSAPAISTILLDAELPLNTEKDNPEVSLTPDHLAYIIYTSGSTGKPKGVRITHRNAVNFVNSMQARPGITADDRLLAVTTLSFDIALLELMLPLTVGASVDIADYDTVVSGTALAERMTQHPITMMQATPVTWKLLLESGWKGNAKVKALVGGEAFPPGLAAQLLPKLRSLWNMYGPTETTVWSSIYPVQGQGGSVPIGKPINNTKIYLLDHKLQLCPIGVPGEVYIGGAGVAQGYLNRASLSAERFIPDPFSDSAGERLYRTGDLARYPIGGEALHADLDYIGRADQQVKVRGFRIELGEIAWVLMQEKGLKDAVVVAREDEQGDPRLVAYVIAEIPETIEQTPDDHGDLVSALRERAEAQLPSYMVPSFFVVLESFPLTPNGKVDRKALPGPDASSMARVEYVAPETMLERDLAQIWSDVLAMPVEDIGVNDSFFDFGGHSLLAIRAVSRINTDLKTAVALTDIFRLDRIAVLASYIEDINSGRIASPLNIQRFGKSDDIEDEDIEEFEL